MKVITSGKKQRVLYGWEAEGKFWLSRFSKDVPERAKNVYETKEEAEAEAAARNCVIEWEK